MAEITYGGGQLHVEGLDDLRKALRKAGDIELTQEFKDAGWKVANDIVIPGAKARAGSALQRRAAATMKPARIVKGAAVRFGGGFIGSMGAEFGAVQNAPRHTSRGMVHGWNQFPAWRGNGDGGGYMLWPEVREAGERIADVWDELTDPVWRRLFPGVG